MLRESIHQERRTARRAVSTNVSGGRKARVSGLIETDERLLKLLSIQRLKHRQRLFNCKGRRPVGGSPCGFC